MPPDRAPDSHGRALQAESDDLEVIGLALLYPALNGTFAFLAIMEIAIYKR